MRQSVFVLLLAFPWPTINIGESFKYSGQFSDFNLFDQKHNFELVLDQLLSDIDLKRLDPKNKLLLYNRYVLSKISWHFTVAALSKTWVTENIDSVVNKYVRKRLEVPISGTLSNMYLSRNKSGIALLLPVFSHRLSNLSSAKQCCVSYLHIISHVKHEKWQRQIEMK